MAKKETPQSLKDVPDDYLIAYYEHQYERMEKLEGQSLTVTNIVISLSVLAISFGLGNSQDIIGILIGLALLIVMGVVNAFAIAYIISSKSWKNTHQKRAKDLLKDRVLELYEFDKNTTASYIEWLPGRTKFQVSLHVILLLVALGVFCIYSLKLLMVVFP
jgi:hypothetical protein